MDVRMAAALAGGVPDVKQYCAEQGISRQTFYKYRRRFAEEGLDGLRERSRRPHRSPQAISAAMGQLLALTRKELLRDGCDAGAQPILDVLTARVPRPDQWGLAADERWPSAATVHRHLVREGLIEPCPQKRPRSSLHRFTYPRPNDCWQSDWTSWRLANGTRVAIAGSLDDHSRLCCALTAGTADADADLVWESMTDAISRYGVPAMSLTDNGMVYSFARRGSGEAAFEANLRALGVATVTSSPYHPQTCGKIERFWQTLKKWLRARRAPRSLAQLQRLLDDFRAYYNEQRRHAAIGRRTPQSVWDAGPKARPAERPMPARVDVLSGIAWENGNLDIGLTWVVGLGARYAGRRITTVREGRHLALFDRNELVCTMTITDPGKRYHRAPTRRGPRSRQA